MMFRLLRKLGNICCGHKMFLNKIRNIFCVLDTKFVSATNVVRAVKRVNICVPNNVTSFARALRLLSCDLLFSVLNFRWLQSSLIHQSCNLRFVCLTKIATLMKVDRRNRKFRKESNRLHNKNLTEWLSPIATLEAVY